MRAPPSIDRWSRGPLGRTDTELNTGEALEHVCGVSTDTPHLSSSGNHSTGLTLVQHQEFLLLTREYLTTGKNAKGYSRKVAHMYTFDDKKNKKVQGR